MTSAAHFEAKKHAYRQTQDGIVISFVVHPNDVDAALATAPLGTRYMVAFAQIGEDEQPVSPTDKPGQSSQAAGPGKGRRRFDELPRSQQAALMCERADFQKWCEVIDAEGARQAILNMCMVNSRAVLDHDDASARRWDYVLGHFRQATGQMAEMRS